MEVVLEQQQPGQPKKSDNALSMEDISKLKKFFPIKNENVFQRFNGLLKSGRELQFKVVRLQYFKMYILM